MKKKVALELQKIEEILFTLSLVRVTLNIIGNRLIGVLLKLDNVVI